MPQTAASSAKPLTSAACKGVALLFAIGAGWAASVYPLNALVLATAMLGYAALLYWRPALWLLLVPAFVPALDLAPWTGWFYLEDVDLLLLVTAAVGYWRLGPVTRTARLPTAFVLVMGLLSLSILVSTAVGVGWMPVVDANAFASYLSRFNGLRIAKGFFWVIVLLPLLTRSAGPDLCNIRRYFVPGMLLGLTLVCGASIHERMMFTGLLDFSSDYRITAPFSAMHVGGAALDAYLALALPFIAAWMFGEKSIVKSAASMALLLAGAYVALATFSRGAYVAYACSLLVMVVLALVRALRTGAIGAARVAGTTVLLAGVAGALVAVFATSGYRGLGASLGLLGASFVVGGVGSMVQRARHVPLALLAAVVLAASGALLASVTGQGEYMQLLKGSYLVYTLSFALLGAAVAIVFVGAPRLRAFGPTLGLVALLWMGFNTGLVAQHWGGNAALPAIAILVTLSLGLVLLNRLGGRRLWQCDPATVRTAVLCGLLLAVTIPFSRSEFMAERVAGAKDEFGTRMAHWREALQMMKPGGLTAAFGMGTGRYADTYFWKNSAGEVLTAFRYETEGTNAFLRLSAPKYNAGYGEVIRMLQHVDVRPNTSYVLSVDVRLATKNAGIDIALCERLLIYTRTCVGIPVPTQAADGQWHHHEIRVGSDSLGNGAEVNRLPVQLQISAGGEKSIVDVDNLRLIDPRTATDLLHNGSFSNANDHWFFSSDHSHLPWHIENFFVNNYFELGWFGVAGFVLLLITVTARLLRAEFQGAESSGIYLAAVAGFMVLGVIDSLLDVPRITLMFFLIVSVAMLEPLAQRVRRRRTRRASVA